MAQQFLAPCDLAIADRWLLAYVRGSHDVCRALWVPTLVEAGVKVVISGHTHDHRWMNAGDGQPIAQLIGGAPQPDFATFIQGTVTRDTLTLKM